MTFRVSRNGCIRKLNCLSVTFCLIANWQTKFSFNMFPLDIFHWKFFKFEEFSTDRWLKVWAQVQVCWLTCVSLPTWDLLNYHWTENLITDSLTVTRPGEAAPGSGSAGYWQYWSEPSCDSCRHSATATTLPLPCQLARTPTVILLQGNWVKKFNVMGYLIFSPNVPSKDAQVE